MYLRSLRAAFLDDFEEELVLACKVAVLLSAGGYKYAQIRRMLDIDEATFKRTLERVPRASARCG
jgi:hypothetical protein